MSRFSGPPLDCSFVFFSPQQTFGITLMPSSVLTPTVGSGAGIRRSTRLEFFLRTDRRTMPPETGAIARPVSTDYDAAVLAL